ncbi:zf-HC2 domain-containing protein [Streptomyces sp. 1331.2]|uniref:zf-HC2 domain-containing protein n=1 Tax=Streptomyces sp. 1331.2 TaxID=1938835 RepID=UPI000BD08698|nr:zf-HC2 domain-containing protein [Streptomyces sp. 1331.2]SOB80929.1 Putative zinc-finger [Streptomyces sp. 1331.2]
MRCAQFRTALSARLDGEPSGLPDTRLDKHVARCTGCREWLARAEQLGGHVRAAAADGPSAEWSARLSARLSAELATGQEGGPQAGQR